MDRTLTNLEARLEAVLFAADLPLSMDAICRILGEDVPRGEIEGALSALIIRYRERRGGFNLVEVAGGYEFRTREAFARDVHRLVEKRPSPLSDQAMETLAIVAYEQPCTRALIESLRGVDCSGSLRTLLERNMVRIAGRTRDPGRPHLYRTTRDFLRVFSMVDLTDLPDPREVRELTEDHVMQLADYKRRAAQFNLPLQNDDGSDDRESGVDVSDDTSTADASTALKSDEKTESQSDH